MAVGDLTTLALRTIGRLSSAADEIDDLKRKLRESERVYQEQSARLDQIGTRYIEETNRNRSLTATVRGQETEIADLKAQVTRLEVRDRHETGIAQLDNVVVHELKAEYEKLDTLYSCVV
jgi:chromosome segregation ATPase